MADSNWRHQPIKWTPSRERATRQSWGSKSTRNGTHLKNLKIRECQARQTDIFVDVKIARQASRLTHLMQKPQSGRICSYISLRMNQWLICSSSSTFPFVFSRRDAWPVNVLMFSCSFRFCYSQNARYQLWRKARLLKQMAFQMFVICPRLKLVEITPKRISLFVLGGGGIQAIFSFVFCGRRHLVRFALHSGLMTFQSCSHTKADMKLALVLQHSMSSFRSIYGKMHKLFVNLGERKNTKASAQFVWRYRRYYALIEN